MSEYTECDFCNIKYNGHDFRATMEGWGKLQQKTLDGWEAVHVCPECTLKGFPSLGLEVPNDCH